MKKLFFILAALSMLAGSQGPNQCGVAENGGGDFGINNPENGCTEDGATAFFIMGGGSGNTVGIYQHDFGFSIPSDATLDSIKGEVKTNFPSGGDPPGFSLLTSGVNVWVGTIDFPDGDGGAIRWVGFTFPVASFQFVPTSSQMNDALFGQSLNLADNKGAGTFNVDAGRMTIYYAVPVAKKKQTIGLLEHHAQTSSNGYITDKITGESR